MRLNFQIYKKSETKTIFYFPSLCLDDVVELLDSRFRVNPVTDDIYEIFNGEGDFFGKITRKNEYHSYIDLWNLPFEEYVKKDIDEIEKMLINYVKSLKNEKRKKYFPSLKKFLVEMVDAGCQEVKERKPIYSNPNVINFGIDFLIGIKDYLFRKRPK